MLRCFHEILPLPFILLEPLRCHIQKKAFNKPKILAQKTHQRKPKKQKSKPKNNPKSKQEKPPEVNGVVVFFLKNQKKRRKKHASLPRTAQRGHFFLLLICGSHCSVFVFVCFLRLFFWVFCFDPEWRV